MNDEEKYCTYSVDEQGVALMYVDNPPMNALSEKTVNDITTCMLEAQADPAVRVVVLSGRGKAFVAGADIKEFREVNTHAAALAMCERGYLMTRVIEEGDKPVICAINGFCLGGGLELAMACHMRIASDKARLGLPEINLGIIPGFAGTQRLPRIVGKAKALEMILSGTHFSADQALAIGLVNRVVEPESLMDEALTLARTIASKGRLAVCAAMDSARRGVATSFEEGCRIEAQNFARVKLSRDASEGVEAFLSKRTAEFKDI